MERRLAAILAANVVGYSRLMAKDETVKQNRLTLLAHLLDEFSTIADFAEIVSA